MPNVSPELDYRSEVDVIYFCNNMRELKTAFRESSRIIVIKPTRLRNAAAKWIKFGQMLHKTAVFSGLSAIISGFICPDHFIIIPVGIGSLISTGLYTYFIQFHPLANYKMFKVSFQGLSGQDISFPPTVLVRNDNGWPNILHLSITASSTILCAWMLAKKFY